MSKIARIVVEEIQGPSKHGQTFHPHSMSEILLETSVNLILDVIS